MKHIIVEVNDVPPPMPLVDRRKNRDRRAQWRGGRRDSDWVNRPPDAWAKLQTRENRMLSFSRKVLSGLHLW